MDAASFGLPVTRQAFEAYHRVPAPVGKPVVSGDDRLHLKSRTRAPGTRPAAPCGRDDELIGREDKLRRETRPCLRDGRGEKQPAPLALCGERLLGREREATSHDSVEATRVALPPSRRGDLEIAGAPEAAPWPRTPSLSSLG